MQRMQFSDVLDCFAFAISVYFEYFDQLLLGYSRAAQAKEASDSSNLNSLRKESLSIL